MSIEKQRLDLLEIFSYALAEVGGKRRVGQYFTHNPLQGDALAILAIGKAADAMLEGVLEVYGERVVQGLLITKEGYLPTYRHPAISYLESAHPVPDERSLTAGQAVLEFLANLPVGLPLVVLISGGASSLVEVTAPGISLQQLQEVNQCMLASAWSIDQINTVRRALSTIKGGGLCAYLGQRTVLQLLISDVPGDDPAVIGSGLLFPPVRDTVLPEPLPAWLLPYASAIKVSWQRPSFAKTHIHTSIVANNRDLCQAAADEATRRGFAVTVYEGALNGDQDTVIETILSTLESVAAPGVIIYGGESHLTLPAHPGQGGRNQQLALRLAEHISKGHDTVILVAGTDGSDGPTDVAGAMVDEGTARRGEVLDMSLKQHISEANAGPFLAATGDLVDTGPTGTNVMDIVIACKVGAFC